MFTRMPRCTPRSGRPRQVLPGALHVSPTSPRVLAHTSSIALPEKALVAMSSTQVLRSIILNLKAVCTPYLCNLTLPDLLIGATWLENFTGDGDDTDGYGEYSMPHNPLYILIGEGKQVTGRTVLEQ
jgi:hypothetical protein